MCYRDVCCVNVLVVVADVAYGSVVTLKSHRTGGAYLHSHPHLYPERIGRSYQQVAFCSQWVAMALRVLVTLFLVSAEATSVAQPNEQ